MIVFTAAALWMMWSQGWLQKGAIRVQHDDVDGVTCWVYENHGISCLPDRALTPPAMMPPTQMP